MRFGPYLERSQACSFFPMCLIVIHTKSTGRPRGDNVLSIRHQRNRAVLFNTASKNKYTDVLKRLLPNMCFAVGEQCCLANLTV